MLDTDCSCGPCRRSLSVLNAQRAMLREHLAFRNFSARPSANKMFTSKAFDAVGGGALRWRIFDFGKVNAEVAQAKGANTEALALYKQSVLRAAEDVENSLMLLTQTQIHVQELQDQVEALRKARDLSEQAYRAGSITLTDVLDANRELLGGQDELDANRADAARAAVAVYRAFGGGWDAPAVQTAKR